MDDAFLALIGATVAGGAFPAVLDWTVSKFSRKARTGVHVNEHDIALAYEEEVQHPSTSSPSSPASAPTPTTAAQAEAIAIMKVYMRDLLAEAARIAKRVGAEQPSKDHVKNAADRIGVLRNRVGVIADIVFGLGSILLGVGISFQINLSTGGDAADGSGVWIAAATVLGGVLIGSAAVAKWRGR